MKRTRNTIARIVFSLVGLTTTLLLAAQMLNLIPDERPAIVKGRVRFCESLAISSSLLAERNDYKALQTKLNAIAKRNDDVLSMAVRRRNGEFAAVAGDHARHWRDVPPNRSTETHMSVPLTAAGKPWGTVEVSFTPVRAGGPFGWLQHPVVLLTAFLAAGCAVAFYWFLRKVLTMLNPSRVVPPRVRSALDTLAEGLIVLDDDGRIVLANKSFTRTAGSDLDQLVGRTPDELPWLRPDIDDGDSQSNQAGSFPWVEALETGESSRGELISLDGDRGQQRTFVVNSTPLRDDDGKPRGVMATFEDVTPLEKKKSQLADMLHKLRKSSDEVRRHNEKLEALARQDPLTGCFNRRSFFEQFETHWKAARRYEHPLSAVMVDVDHFKSINDNHGHAVGDQVLQKVAAALRAAARATDVVCRYGGEEFSILLPHTETEEAMQAGERLRTAIESLVFLGLSVTASVGVSTIATGTRDPQELLDLADKALYVAKRTGRNRVVRWEDVPPDQEIDESQVSRTPPDAEPSPIPFNAVTALISALAYRDLGTAQHSRRVADLCVLTAQGLMSISDSYVLENAALLHDIGKIGVPDCILLKPGALTREEWEVMHRHDRIGTEIIRASFHSQELSEIVENHHAFFDVQPDGTDFPTGDDIPLGARILIIADAYDAMVSDRVYRSGRGPEEAFEELRRCAGTQFDPVLVERFIERVSDRNRSQTGTIDEVPKETALSIGLQIERLTYALEAQDRTGLQATAERLNATATQHRIPTIAGKAHELQTSLGDDADLMGVLQTANELLAMCRSTQASFLSDNELFADRLKSPLPGD